MSIRKIKKLKAKTNQELTDLIQVCKLLSDHLYIFPNKDNVEIELQDEDSSLQEVIQEVMDDLPEQNSFKNNTESQFKKIIKKYYILIQIYHSLSCLESANDHSWDNAVFNGAL